MRWLEERKGYSLIEVLVVLTLLAIVMGTLGPLSRRVIARYQLNTAVQMLQTDLAHAKIRAIQTNAYATVKLENSRYYRAAGAPRQLPGIVRFNGSTADSVSFNGLGAVADGVMVSFVLVNPYGESREIRVYAAGGQEVRKL